MTQFQMYKQSEKGGFTWLMPLYPANTSPIYVHSYFWISYIVGYTSDFWLTEIIYIKSFISIDVCRMDNMMYLL